MTEDQNPAARAVADIEPLPPATDRLVHTASGLTDEQIGGPSLLPDWTRGHVLAHIARNADGFARVLSAAREGRTASFYDSDEVRNRDIAAGAPRPAAEHLEDLRASAARMSEALAAMTPEAWTVEADLRGRLVPAWRLPWLRLAEVEYHHADLDAGYSPGHWGEPFVSRELDRLAEKFADADLPGMLLRDVHSGTERTIGAVAERPYTVAGTARALLAWLSGRATADGLTVHRDGARLADPAAELPAPPPVG